jgi:thiosulfate dehydrogenase
MISKQVLFLTLGTAIVMTLALMARPPVSHAQEMLTHDLPHPAHGGTVVMLCDGKTSIEIKDLKRGKALTHEEAQSVANALMAKWRREHPDQHWQMAQTEAPPASSEGPPASYSESSSPSSGVPAAKPLPTVQQGDTYASFQPRDYKVWKTETDKFVAEGKRIFHDANALGSTISVSCDMCHPDAANTHPETYPKYQVQLQKVALLRDMIDWCIENPIKGKALDPNDAKLRALEAYIYAQRKGVPLDYGKH